MTDETQDPEVRIAQVAEGPQPTLSVADLLRKGYNDAAAAKPPKDILIPGYGEPDTELHGLFRILDDYEEVRDGLKESMRQRNVKPAQRELEGGMDTLLMASIGSYAVVNGQRHEIGHPLGVELYDYLFPDDGSPRPGNDRQALVLLFHRKTMPIMTAYMELDQWIRRGGVDAEEESLGNF